MIKTEREETERSSVKRRINGTDSQTQKRKEERIENDNGRGKMFKGT